MTTELDDADKSRLNWKECCGTHPTNSKLGPHGGCECECHKRHDLQAKLDQLHTPRPFDDWHEDIGNVLWWSFPISEPPFSGDPHDSDFPFEHDDPSVGWVPLPNCDKIQEQWDAIEKSKQP